jgi:kynureninase
VTGPEDLTEPGVFLAQPNSACSDWSSVVAKFSDEAASWQSIDPNIPASDWTPEQKTINATINPIMSANADELERLGRKSGNAIFEDFAILAAQYRRAFVVANPTYSSADSYLAESATQLVRTIDWACKAAQ